MISTVARLASKLNINMSLEQSETKTEVAETTAATETTTPETAESKPAKKSGGLKNKLIVIGILLVGFVAAGLVVAQKDGAFGLSAAAYVNGEAITQEQLDNTTSNLTAQLAAQGFDTSSADAQEQIAQDALNRLINTRMLIQAASDNGYEASEEQIETQVAAITEQIGGEEALSNYLTDVEMSESEMREDIAEQISVDNYLNGETGIASIEITDEEAQEYYNQLSSQYAGEDIPALEEVQDQLKQDLLAQKQELLLGEVIADLRANAVIKIN